MFSGSKKTLRTAGEIVAQSPRTQQIDAGESPLLFIGYAKKRSGQSARLRYEDDITVVPPAGE